MQQFTETADRVIDLIDRIDDSPFATDQLVSSDDTAAALPRDAGWALFNLRNTAPVFSYRDGQRGAMKDVCPDRGAIRTLNCIGRDGRLATFECPSPGSITYWCAVRTFLPVCLVYEPVQGGFARSPQCARVDHDAYYTSCRCRLRPANVAGAVASSQLLVVGSAGLSSFEPLRVVFASSVFTAFPTPAPSRQLQLELVLFFTGLSADNVTPDMNQALRKVLAQVLGLALALVGVPRISQHPMPTPEPSPLPSARPSARPSSAFPTQTPIPTMEPTSPCDNEECATSRQLASADGFAARVLLWVPSVWRFADTATLAATCNSNSTLLLGAVQAQCKSVGCSGLILAHLQVEDLTPTSEPTHAPASPSPAPVLGEALPAPLLAPSPLLLWLAVGMGVGLPTLALLAYCGMRTRERRLRKVGANLNGRVAPAPDTEWMQQPNKSKQGESGDQTLRSSRPAKGRARSMRSIEVEEFNTLYK